MADDHCESDGEDDIISATGKTSNCSVDSEEDSLLGFEDDSDEEDEELDIGEPATSNETAKSNGEVPAKRKRKQADPTKRKRIRRILREDELTDVTISAQKEERERLRRLELQRSLATAGTSSMPASKVVENLRSDSPISNSSKPSSPVAVDVREKKEHQPHVIIIDSDDEGDSTTSTVSYCDAHRSAEVNGDLIEIISSDSEVELDDSDNDDDNGASPSARNDVDYDNSGLHTDDTFNKVDPQGRVLVNVNHPAEEEDIFLAPQIAKVIKAHQIGGIRFLYDNLVETLKRFKVSSGFGCILAHSMGLGKTLQVASFIDIFLRYTPAKKVLCIVPINTIQNWQAEFNMWLPPNPGLITNSNGTVVETSDSSTVRYRDFEVYLLGDNHKTTMARAKVIGEWNQHGGVLLMGYELYRLLSTATPSMSSSKSMPTKKKKSPTPSVNGEPEVIDLDEEEKHMELLIGVQKALCRPGADLVICDEGHRIKNDQANTSQALKKIHTRRRVVLTGYPLQNNLQEYWCMVDFVRPNFLGTKQEFCNMFERPILNGQCSDSTPSDVRVMRYRAHVLHSLLEGFVQRRSQAVLKKCLPSKEEHIVLVNMSPIQKELYNTFVENLMDSVGYINPIKGFHTCTKIWNHPDIFYRSLNMKNNDRNESPLTILEDSNGSNGSSQNSTSFDTSGSSSNLLPNAGISQNQSSATQLSPYFPSSSNTQTVNIQPAPVPSQLPNQTVVRSAMQLHQMVSYQLAGQTMAMSVMTTQASQSTSNNVIQPVATQSGVTCNSPLTNDMTWAKNLFKDYQPGVMNNGGKLVVLMDIIEESLKLGEKILIFSQSLSTLSVIEEFLSKRDVPFFPGRVSDPLKPVRWAKNKSYFRLDGNTSAQERERLINRFNATDNTDVLLFMLSTRAGCLGINLVGASRVVVFDASWNPCHDVQAVCRVYRYGQEKPVHIYRLISTGTMEKKIYDRQISKQGMANRIVDELNPEANFTKQEIMKLICEKEAALPAPDLAAAADKFNDPVLVRLCRHCGPWISKIPFRHESLLVDKKEMKLTKAEKKEAKRGYELEKRAAMQGNRYCPGVIQPVYNRNPQPYVPNSTYPVGAVPQQQRILPNCTHHQPSPHVPAAAMHLPLASLLRAGVAVPSGAQITQPVSRHNSTSSTSTSASSNKDEVVMIDLDELPSPTKPMQEPVSLQASQTRVNNDLVRMARNAFPNISPQFIGMLINQGNAQVSQTSNAQASQATNAQGSQTSNAQGNQAPNTAATQVSNANGSQATNVQGSQVPGALLSQASTVHPQASTQVLNIDGDSGEKGASVENTSNGTSTAKNSQLSETQLSKSPLSQGTVEEQTAPSTPLVLDVVMVSNETNNPTPQGTATVSASPTPPIVQDVSTASNQPDNPVQQETSKVRSSPNPPTGNELRSSPSLQGEAGKDSTSSKEEPCSKKQTSEDTN